MSAGGLRACRNPDGTWKRSFHKKSKAKEFLRRARYRTGLVPYRCSACGFFHIGHQIPFGGGS